MHAVQQVRAYLADKSLCFGRRYSARMAPPETLWDRFLFLFIRFSFDARTNKTMPNLVQVVAESRSYRNKVVPVSSSTFGGPRSAVSLLGSSGSELPSKDAPQQQDQPPAEDVEEFVKSTRETLMGATIDGLVNKASAHA